MKIVKPIILGAALVCAVVGLAAGQTVVGSHHDLRATGGGTPTGTGLVQVCVTCHTPHQDAAASGQDPLWNHTLSTTASYGVYASSTLNATPTDIGLATAGSATVSHLCLSCHDGTVSVLSMYKQPVLGGTPTVSSIVGIIDATGKIISSANMGVSLTDDHPVNFDYTGTLATNDGGLKTPTSTSQVDAGGIIKLFGGTGSVQCASCHNAHDDTNSPFLRTSNTASALCLMCHNK